MSDLTDLYHDVILDHGKRPRNHGPLEDATHHAEGYNPLCGDRVEIHARAVDGRVERLAFTGDACAICTASASLLTEAMAGRSREEIETAFRAFRRLLTGEPEPSDEAILDKLAVLAGVRAYPMRVKCATLPWHTLHAALRGEDAPVTTED